MRLLTVKRGLQTSYAIVDSEYESGLNPVFFFCYCIDLKRFVLILMIVDVVGIIVINYIYDSDIREDHAFLRRFRRDRIL